MTTICVPSDCTLHEAIRRSNQCDTQTTILLKKGEYDIKARRSLICIQKYACDFESEKVIERMLKL